MPVVSRPQPGGRLAWSTFAVSTDYQYLAHRDLCSRRAGLVSACRRHLLHETGRHAPAFSPTAAGWPLTSTRSGEREIWLADPDGSNAVQLTSMAAYATGYPHWSPDGERIVFHSNLEGQWEVYVIPAAGGKPRNLTSHPAVDRFPSFSAGRQVDLLHLEPNGRGPRYGRSRHPAGMPSR